MKETSEGIAGERLNHHTSPFSSFYLPSQPGTEARTETEPHDFSQIGTTNHHHKSDPKAILCANGFSFEAKAQFDKIRNAFIFGFGAG